MVYGREYQNFDVVIEKSGEKFVARVIRSPAGQAKTEFEYPFEPYELENFVLRMGRPRSGMRRIDSPEMAAAKDLGKRLFTTVFSGEVNSCYLRSIDNVLNQNKGLRLRLHINVPEFNDYPWEFLYNPQFGQFVALSQQTPIIRYIDLPYTTRSLPVPAPLKILVMISSPEGYPQLDIQKEWERINQALKPLLDQRVVALEKLEQPTLSALQKKLRQDKTHIFHYIGHGKYFEDKQEGMLLLEDEYQHGMPTTGQQLGAILHDHYHLRLVVLNACEGARTSKEDPYAGVAQTLVRQGIPAVLAMQFEIFEDAAMIFAEEFYSAMVDNYPVDAALSEARKAIFASKNDVEWGTPVLFMRTPDGILFRSETAEEWAERMAVEKEAREKSEREAAEKAVREKAEREAAERAAKQKVELEAAKKAAIEKAKLEAAERAEQERKERERLKKEQKVRKEKEAAEKTAREKAEREAAENADQERKERERLEREEVIRGKRKPAWLILGIGGVITLALVGLIIGGTDILRNVFAAIESTPTNDVQPGTTHMQVTKPTVTIVSATTTFTPTVIPTPTLGVGSTMVSEKDGMVMVYVPEGEFKMGTDTDEAVAECQSLKLRIGCSRNWFKDEEPVHTEFVDAFWIDQTEVTNAMYSKCVVAGICNLPDSTKSFNRDNYYGNPEFDSFPVIYVSWNDAKAYCEWAGRRLPSEAEWEKAASWDEESHVKRAYPWGNNFDCNYGNFDDEVQMDEQVVPGGENCDGFDTTSPVGSFLTGASFYGVLDMSGNVLEWVDSWYDVYPGGDKSISNLFGQTYRVVRGGSWRGDQYNFFHSTDRGRNKPSFSSDFIGFRCSHSK